MSCVSLALLKLRYKCMVQYIKIGLQCTGHIFSSSHTPLEPSTGSVVEADTLDSFKDQLSMATLM